MKKILISSLVALLGFAGLGYSCEIPEGVKKLVEQFKTDPEIKYGINHAKKRRYIEHNVKPEDIHIGLPIEHYRINYNRDSIDINNVNIRSVITPTDIWYIPFRVENKYSYHVKVFYLNGKYLARGCGEGVIDRHTWNKVRKKYPESTGITPIYIEAGRKKLLHFPNEKPNNIFYVRSAKFRDSLSLMSSQSLDSLDDIKTVLYFRQKDWERRKRKKNSKYLPIPSKGESGGKK